MVLHKTKNIKPFSPQATALKKGIYQHYSGNYYKVLSVARHSETLEECVVYQQQYGSYDVWIRPLSMFCENVIIDNMSVPRFRLISEQDEHNSNKA